MSKINIIMYHYVRDLKNSRYPEIKGLDYKEFQEQIQFIQKNFHVIRIEDVIASYEQKEKLPENAALLTFDDGYIDHYTYCFPILDAYRLQGTFYIPGKPVRENILLDVNKIHFILASASVSDIMSSLLQELDRHRDEFAIESNEVLLQKYAVANRFDKKETIFIKRILQTVLPEKLRGRISNTLFEKYVGLPEKQFAKELYMNEDQIRCMKNHGMCIGLHGYDHYWLANLSKKEMEEDIDKSIHAMEEFIDKENWVFNYPYGSYNEEVVDFIKRRGCKLSMTTEVGSVDTEKNGRYTLPRWDTNDFPPKSSNYRKNR